MKILDLYIARQFLANAAILIALLGAFVVAIDASLNIDEFLEAGRARAATEDRPAGALRVAAVTTLLVVDLWWPRLLQLFNFMLGVVMVGAMGFTIAQMSRHRELVAILASGQSLFRVARPIAVAAIGLTAIQALNSELVLPRIAPLLARDRPDAAARSLGPTRIPLARDGQGRLFYAERFDAAGAQLEVLTIWELDDQGHPTARIVAERAAWRDGAWQLAGGQVRRRLDDGLGPSEPIVRVASDLDPTQLMMLRYRGYSQSMSWAQADRLLRSLRNLDPIQERRLSRIKWGRIPTMTANLLALIITVPFFLSREPRNMLVQSLRAAPVALGAVVGGVIGASAGVPGVPPAVGVFLPVAVLLPLAAGMMLRLGDKT